MYFVNLFMTSVDNANKANLDLQIHPFLSHQYLQESNSSNQLKHFLIKNFFLSMSVDQSKDDLRSSLTHESAMISTSVTGQEVQRYHIFLYLF